MTDPLAVLGIATVAPKGAKRAHRGHPWIYRSDVLKAPAVAGVVDVRTSEGHSVGLALSSPESEIRLRMLTQPDQPLDRHILKARFEQALERRRRLLPGVDGFRWVHGEADMLPGVFVDVYGDAVALQLSCAGADVLTELWVDILTEILSPRVVVLRNDTKMRSQEGLERFNRMVMGEGMATAAYHEGEIRIEVDLLGDQKTGSFLDQRDNHIHAGSIAQGSALDCCTYHGGFALQMARSCTDVLAVDSSAEALASATAIGEKSGISNVTWKNANVFDFLPKLQKEGRLFDTIVLDPPALATGKKSLPNARRAYRDLNRRALRLLCPNGLLITCSCSGRIGSEEFDTLVAEAARAAGRRIHWIARRGAGVDHPALAGVPETEYLKYRVVMALP